MLEEHYPFVAQPLPYEYDALLPVLDEETLHFHHDKHYQTYVDKLNAILADYPQLQQMTLTELLTSEDNKLASLQEEARESIHNNGGGVYNHQLYFDSMRSPVGQEPCGTLEEALIRDFGSVRQWKEQMSQSAIGVFGSGWAWLVSDQDGTLMILTTANQDVPDLRLYTPILLIDVWEHAYYLQYRNRRPDYVQGWHKLIHWKKAERRYEQVLCRLIIKKEQVETVYDSRFIKVFDLQYEPGKHYFDATRRSIENLAAVKNDEEFKQMLPDAVSCVVILKISGQEPRLCLSREYRYPAGQFLLSVPAGLLDPEDAAQENPVFHAAIRELREETGIALEESDSIRLVNPLVFSTPGMTDESNALVQITLNREEMPKVSQEGAVGTECFDGFLLLTREEAQKILKDGVDDQGLFYPLYTWAALMCFVTGMWE